ncbi:MAG: molybdenum cofactor biosysynthesis protein [Rhodobacteraceae bacterium]|jgi:uncharacterized protein YcbX|uniref:MOSC domain-containing protein n=1 Tax=Salipiger profundus TaxID=1229727 RepID=A0A1U7D548_9RHOB|nr:MULTISPECIES: MOSC domain-containing protein [Salipiger]APX23243.1 hypothetical protein Ga0080559_TMP2447 [Salipiger profundus]MAB04860.1 molybdenum cofactor biosysynthesis protein [Paracoccaceae bacterium]GGA14229.1 molybdenum cofactor biosysynthesis protein [Salipiger profundus]SFD49573.1 hypothetical protein SAMN05444415_111155 [Salipiger profundus]
MTVRLAQIRRHPIKGIGSEPLDEVILDQDAPMPGDRAWALQHENAEAAPTWQSRGNFLVVANGPKLAPVRATTGRDGRITLTHPERADLVISPGTDGPALIDWVKPLWPETSPAPRALVPAPPQGMADNGRAELSILNLASLRALSEAIGKPLEIERFRGNLILDGLEPWQEFDWIGQTLQIGRTTLEVTQRIQRCRATEANPDTGERDANVLRALHTGFGHRDFGVYAKVTHGGLVATGYEVTTP